MENFDEFFTRQNLKNLGFKNISELSNLEFGEIREFIANKTNHKPDSGCFALLAMTEKELKSKMPVAYITNQIKFPNITLKITEDVLIPRVETEWLIELTSTILRTPSTIYKRRKKDEVLEVGVGSGYIILSLAKKFPNIGFTGIDISKKAIELATYNQKLNKISNVNLICSGVEKFTTNRQFDLIISNPPYIPLKSKQVAKSVRKFEPAIALFSGLDGLEVSREIINFGKKNLKQGGKIMLELNSKAQMLKLQKEFGNDFNFKFEKDVFEKWRYLRLNQI